MPVVWLLAACCFALGCSQQFILGIPNQIADSLGVSLADVGQLMTVFGFANALGTPVLLAATGRWSQRRQLLAGLVLMGVGMAVMALSSSYGVIVGTRVIMGMGNGMFVATAMSLATTLARPGHEASALANISVGFSLSQVLAMPLARALAPYVDWHLFYGALAVVALGALLAIARLIPDGAAAGAGLGLRERMAPLGNPRIAAALFVVFSVSVGYSAFYTYISPFLEGVFGAEGHAVSTVLLVSGLMTMVGSKGSGWLADRFGCRVAIGTCLTLQVVLLSAIGLGQQVPAVVAVGICGWAIADWGFIPAQNLLLTQLAGTSAPMAIALSSSFLQLGNATGAAVSSGIIGAAPVSVLPLVAAGTIAASCLVEAWVLRKGTPIACTEELA